MAMVKLLTGMTGRESIRDSIPKALQKYLDPATPLILVNLLWQFCYRKTYF